MTSAARVARAFFAAYDAHDIDGMLGLCSEDGTLRHVSMGSHETGSIHTMGVKAWSDIFKALPDMRVSVTTFVADSAVAGAEVVIADHKRAFELAQAYFLTIDDAQRITDVTVYWDNVGLGPHLTKAGTEELVHALESVVER
jgi:ketosteroid isomerase-like protein